MTSAALGLYPLLHGHSEDRAEEELVKVSVQVQFTIDTGLHVSRSLQVEESETTDLIYFDPCRSSSLKENRKK